MLNKSPLIKKIIFVLCVGLMLFGTARLYYYLTDDIRLANMTYEIPFHQEWEISPLSPMEKQRVDAILNQSFRYIGKGAQSYAFVSEDGMYVLKMFKFKHLKPSLWMDLIPPIGPLKTWKEHEAARKSRKLESVFTGYRLAYEVHKDPSGIILIHLNPSETLHKNVTIIDKMGFNHTVDLDKFVFVIQEKGIVVRDVLKSLLDKEDLVTAKLRINQMLDLYVSEYKKGIYDHDHGVMYNTGFVGQKPLHLDVGKLMEAPEAKNPAFVQKDLSIIAHKFHIWMHSYYPQYATELDNSIETKMSHIVGHPWTFEENKPS